MRLDRTGDALIIEADSEAGTARLGAAIADVVAPGVVIGLIGPLGAGKTRLVRALAEALGAPAGAIASPTFVLIHEYDSDPPVYHFDAYRLDDSEAFDDLGAADYYAAGGVCLIEWADRVLDRVPVDAWLMEVEPTGPEERRFRLRAPADVLDRLAAALAGGD